ncbi:hypothetical protein BDQ12DRAFT_688942 [Crucibulum laeve]|uniref:Uncharacterized protein n=1 Tax=Crucibulum laeve TaxID=68775 RepID=A0A5C3LS23_9AGAR|nr:hypothetical protein BDQ12DRAFT_688942 [Crucibulum laeve]
MPLASHGALRAAARKVSNALVNGGHNGPGHTTTSRSIHIPTAARQATAHAHPAASVTRSSTTQKLFTQTRTLLAQFFTHLTAPGLHVPTYAHNVGSRSLHTAGRATIQSGFSLPVRTALARQNIFLPRAPAPIRNVAQVGLGTARNFSSSRPLFQNLVQNVPVAGRAFCEVDWEVKMRREDAKMRRVATGKQTKAKYGKEMMKVKEAEIKMIIGGTDAAIPTPEEMEHYFPAAVAPAVTTYLLIPLAPTPTSRVPLPSTSSADRLLPLPQIASMHASHSVHSLRVSTLFMRLDQANVWARGVKCSAYGQGQGKSDDSAVCTVLKVTFEGWTKAEVRSVIGESGTGWCVLEEEYQDEQLEESEDEDGLSDASSIFSNPFEDYNPEAEHQMNFGMPAIDPSQSFVLPTLDFSSSFISSTASPPTTSVHAEGEFDDPWADDFYPSSPSLSSVSSSASLSSGSWVEPPSTNGWFVQGLGFSSQFAGRGGFEDGEPREQMFY